MVNVSYFTIWQTSRESNSEDILAPYVLLIVKITSSTVIWRLGKSLENAVILLPSYFILFDLLQEESNLSPVEAFLLLVNWKNTAQT